MKLDTVVQAPDSESSSMKDNKLVIGDLKVVLGRTETDNNMTMLSTDASGSDNNVAKGDELATGDAKVIIDKMEGDDVLLKSNAEALAHASISESAGIEHDKLVTADLKVVTEETETINALKLNTDLMAHESGSGNDVAKGDKLDTDEEKVVMDETETESAVTKVDTTGSENDSANDDAGNETLADVKAAPANETTEPQPPATADSGSNIEPELMEASAANPALETVADPLLETADELESAEKDELMDISVPSLPVDEDSCQSGTPSESNSGSPQKKTRTTTSRLMLARYDIGKRSLPTLFTI